MDIFIYCEILAAKGINCDERKDADLKSLTTAEIAFRKDLAARKMVWTGRVLSDFWFYLISQHAVFSWFCCRPYCGVPKQHPYSRYKRLGVLLIGLGWSLIWTSAFIQEKQGESADEQTNISFRMDWWITTSLIGLVITTFCSINKAIGTCSCVQGSTTSTRTCCEMMGCMWLIFNVIVALIMAFVGIMSGIAYGFFDTLILGMIKANLESWFVWDILKCAFKFFIGCGKCKKSYWKRRQIGRSESKLCIHWKDFAYYIDPNTKGDPQYAPQNKDMQYHDISAETSTQTQPVIIQQPVFDLQTITTPQHVYVQQPVQVTQQYIPTVYLQQDVQKPMYYTIVQ